MDIGKKVQANILTLHPSLGIIKGDFDDRDCQLPSRSASTSTTQLLRNHSKDFLPHPPCNQARRKVNSSKMLRILFLSCAFYRCTPSCWKASSPTATAQIGIEQRPPASYMFLHGHAPSNIDSLHRSRPGSSGSATHMGRTMRQT